MNEKRLEWNKKCIKLLISFLENNPYLRLEQAIYILDKNLDLDKDYFNEEPWETYNRWVKQLN